MRTANSPSRRLVLASASPNRLAILESCGINPEVMSADIDEQPFSGEGSVELTTRLANAKCEKIVSCLTGPNNEGTDVVVAADTVVESRNLVLGKPQSRDDAYEMLTGLSDKTHKVISGVAVGSGGSISVGHAITSVTFRKLGKIEIDDYLDSGDYKGKAGAYGIQGIASVFVDHIVGSHQNVVGLPTHVVEQLLSASGLSLFDWRLE